MGRLLLAGFAAASLLGVSCGGDSRQDEVAERGAEVMPFDLDATTHRFDKRARGGVQIVIADDQDDVEQVRLVREHLRDEAARFGTGDFADPMTIHGDDMPGVAALSARARQIEIAYADVAGGARVTFTTDDAHLVAAIHDWFDAQVSDHGRHAEHTDASTTG